MYSKYNLILATLSLLLFFNLTACSDDSTTGDDDDISQATINGTVEDDFAQAKQNSNIAAKQLENTVVYAGRFSSNGSVEIIEETETEVTSSGEFSLEVDANTAEEIVVVAENEGERLTGFITAEVENGSSYEIKPIDAEHSAETEVFSEVKASGNADVVHKSDIETIITENSEAEIYGNSSATSDIAAAVSNSAEARAEFFEEFSEGDADANIESYFETMTQAQLDYESDVNATSSTDQEEAAFESYLETKVNAYADAGLEEKENAEFLHMRGVVLLNSTSDISTEIENDVRNSSSYMIAIAMDNAVQARAEASEMSENTVSAIADAGVVLRTDVRESNGSEATIEAAFETYHNEVRTAIENDPSTEGTAIVTVDAEIHVAGGAKTTFDSALSGVVDASVLTDAYIQFDNSVQSIVESNSALVGDIDAEILSDIMVLINLSSS